MLEFDRVSVGYSDLTVIQDVSFRVGEGEVVSLVGSNGAGKTTILRTIAGLLHPSRGEIRLRDQPIHRTPPYDIVGKYSHGCQTSSTCISFARDCVNSTTSAMV